MDKSEFLELNLPSRDNATDIADINAISDNFRTIDSAFLDLVEKELPKYQTKDNLIDVISDNSSNDNLYPSAPAVSKYTNRKVKPLKIVNSASGNAIALKDSANDKLVNLKLFGKTTQNGTPTPDAPVPLVSVGDSGSFEVGVYGQVLVDFKNAKPRGYTHIFSYQGNKIHYENTTGYNGCIDTGGVTLPAGIYTAYIKNVSGDTNAMVIGVAGLYMSIQAQRQVFKLTEPKTVRLMISTNNMITIGSYDCYCGIVAGNVPLEQCPVIDEDLPDIQTLIMPYTLRGIGDIKDGIDFVNGILWKRTNVITLNGSEEWSVASNNRAYIVFNDIATPKATNQIVNAISNSFKAISNDSIATTQNNGFAVNASHNLIFKYDDVTASLDTWKAYLQANPITVIYELATDTAIGLTKTELNAYRHLMTNKPNTTILSEADMEVSYVADPKLYIDNKIAELTALTLEG